MADNLRAFSLTTRFKKVALTAIAHNLSEAEREKLRASFIAMDKDSNGFLTLNEFKEGLAVLGSSVPADLAEIMEHVDTNHDGGVEYTEFLAAAMDERLHRDEECCWKAFKAFDNDSDGFITKEELRGLIEGCLGDQLRDQVPSIRSMSVENMFDSMDQDQDGQITFEEFLEMVRDSGLR